MQSITLNFSEISDLMPMHLLLDRDGGIISCGRTMRKIVGDRARVDDVFSCDGAVILRSFSQSVFDRIAAGERIIFRVKAADHIALRVCGRVVHGGLLLLNAGFGVHLIDAIQRFDLTSTDFLPTDLVMEFLFLNEANGAAMSALSAVNISLEDARVDAHNSAMTDPLTGLMNRRAFEHIMPRAFRDRWSKPFALIALDIDDFKGINDTLGHAVGDAVLVEVARVISSSIRTGDAAFRIGGDEFVILISWSDADGDPVRFCDRVISGIAAAGRKLLPLRLRVSLGVALSATLKDASYIEIYERADVALYKAKEAGKGRAVLSKGYHVMPREVSGY